MKFLRNRSLLSKPILALWLLVCASPALHAVTLEGEFLQGGLVVGRTQPGDKVMFDGAALHVSKQGVFLLGFGRDAELDHRLEVIRQGKRVERKEIAIGKRDYHIQRIDGLPPSKVTPPERDWARIKRETALVKKARARDDGRTDFLTGFVWPAKGVISGVYGSQRILNGKPRRPHFGIDIAAPVGTPVFAPADGIVTLAYPDMFYSGGTLILDHGLHLSSSFLHLSRILVKVGDRVKQGDKIAEIGATGRVTGPHVDWRMNLRNARLDPELLVPPMPLEPKAEK
ncbi:MAG: M23 family metallopeptidase [Candidatus Thiodiazotropha sp.]